MTRVRAYVLLCAVAASGCAKQVLDVPTTHAPAGTDWTRVNDALFAGEATDLQQLAFRAYVWGMPLVAAAQIRHNFTSPNDAGSGSPINRFIHRRKLAGPEMRVGVGPNNDTIYSLAWVDLSDGPLILTTPDFGERYYTFSINQADSSSEQSLGQRTHGGQLPPVFIHGPGFSGPVPEGMVDVPSQSRFVNLAGRILVRGPEDYPLVHRLQDRIKLTRWADWLANRDRWPSSLRPSASDPLERREDGALAFLAALGAALRDGAVSRLADLAMVRSFAPLGLSIERGFDPSGLDHDSLAVIRAGWEKGREQVLARSRNLGVQRNGWTINYHGPRFGKDYVLRAGVAKDQIFVAVPEESIYPIGRVDAAGRPLDGSQRYRIRFAPGRLPPVDAFWSITAYDDDGFMIPNAAERYSVGDRTAGLVSDADGGLTIELSATAPPQNAAVNWLPVASGKPFYLMMRLYRPKDAVLNGQWIPPAIEAVD